MPLEKIRAAMGKLMPALIILSIANLVAAQTQPTNIITESDVGDWVGRWEVAAGFTNKMEVTFVDTTKGNFRITVDTRRPQAPCVNMNVQFVVVSAEDGLKLRGLNCAYTLSLGRVGPRLEGLGGGGFKVILEKRR